MNAFPAMTFPPMLSDDAWNNLSEAEQAIYLRWRRSAATARRHLVLGPGDVELLIKSSADRYPSAAVGGARP